MIKPKLKITRGIIIILRKTEKIGGKSVSKKDREKQRIKENRRQIAFIGQKTSFLSALIVVITMFNECLGIIYEDNPNMNYIYIAEIIVSMILYYVILCTKKLDRIIDTQKVRNFSELLTIASIVVFILALSIKISPNPFLVEIGLVAMCIEVLGLGIYLLFG